MLAFQRVRSASLIIFLLCVSLRISWRWVPVFYQKAILTAYAMRICLLLIRYSRVRYISIKGFVYLATIRTYVSDSDQADEAFRAGWREEEEGPDDPVLTGARSFREDFSTPPPYFQMKS